MKGIYFVKSFVIYWTWQEIILTKRISLIIFEKKIIEKIISLHIEKLPEGYYLATSDDIQGLVAQGRTIAETIEIARDVAKKLIEARYWIKTIFIYT